MTSTDSCPNKTCTYIIKNKYAGPPYSRTKIYAVRMSYAADVAHGTKQQSGWTAADVDRYVLPAPDLSSKPLAAAAAAVDRRDTRRTDTRPFYEAFSILCGPRDKHTRLTALFKHYPGKPAGTRKAKPIWILLKQETVSGIGISWAICKSAPRSRQITTLASSNPP